MDTKDIILGCGISGLIFAYYNPNTIILTNKIGGKINENSCATMLLHDNKQTRNLMNDLNISFRTAKHSIKYIHEHKILNNLTVEHKKQLINKKLTNYDEISVNKKFEITDLTLSTNDNFINVLKVNSYFLFRYLYNVLKDRIYITKINSINTKTKTIKCENESYDYQNLISTIPAPVFFKLIGQEIELNYKSITIVTTNIKPIIEDFNLLYNCDLDTSWTRVNKINNKYVYEFTGELKYSDIPFAYTDFNIEKFGLIISKKLPKVENCYFVGRFATWDHSYKIHNSIKDSIDYARLTK